MNGISQEEQDTIQNPKSKIQNSPKSVLYISGEESAQQIKLRSARLGAESPHFLD